jgi:Ni2+-binding GTPase involved in maturation of urease and hydrogenase
VYSLYLSHIHISTHTHIYIHTHTHTGFVLLQGPPGTGKTKVVLRMLNALHIAKFQVGVCERDGVCM